MPLFRPPACCPGRVRGALSAGWALAWASPAAHAAGTSAPPGAVGLPWVGLAVACALALAALLFWAWYRLRARPAWAALLAWVAEERNLGDPPRSPPEGLAAPMSAWLAERAQRRREAQRAREQQLERLWLSAGLDAPSALHSRRSFMARLDLHLRSGLLAGDELPPAPSGALLLIRVHGLDRLNRIEGRATGDGLIASIGASLRTYQDRVPGALAGRLSGADFALLLPVTGLADETAHAVQGLLQPLADTFSTRVSVSVGAVEALRALDASRALAQADAALRQAQMGRLLCVLSEPGHDEPSPAVDLSSLWRRCVVGQGEIDLACAPLVGGSGGPRALLCALRMRALADGRWLHALRWRPELRHAGLGAAADLGLLTLALGSAADGLSRCVEMDVESLREPGFIEDAARRLAVQPGQAARLVLELDTQALTAPWVVEAAAAAWRGAGAAVGLVHRGGPWQGLGHAAAVGVNRLAIDMRWLRGGAGDPAVLACAWQAVDTARALGWPVDAREVAEPEDLPWIWEAGFETASGPALAMAAGSAASPASGRQGVPAISPRAPQPMSAQCRP